MQGERFALSTKVAPLRRGSFRKKNEKPHAAMPDTVAPGFSPVNSGLKIKGFSPVLMK